MLDMASGEKRTFEELYAETKLPLYAKCGIGHVWIVDPAIRTVEVYETATERPVLVATARDEETAELPPFEGAFEVGRWWLPA